MNRGDRGPALLNSVAAAQYLGVSRTQFWRLRSGKVPGVPVPPPPRDCGVPRWLRAELDAYAESLALYDFSEGGSAP